MGICAWCEEENSKVNYIKYLQLAKKQPVSISGSKEKQYILTIDTNSDNDWKSLLKEILSEGDDETYKWKPIMLEALKKVKKVDDPRFKSNLFWELYSNAHGKIKEDGKIMGSPLIEQKNETDEYARIYNRLLQKIGSQLEDHDHPFRFLQREFDQYVTENYLKGNIPEYAIMPRLIKDITDIVQVMCYAVIYFYNIKLKLTPRNTELFLGIITDLFVRGESQIIIMKLLHEELKDQIEIFKAKLEKFRKIKLEQLKVSQYLSFNYSFRETFQKISQNDAKKPISPLSHAIEELLKIKQISQPNRKLDQLLIFSKTLSSEIDQFWENYSVKREKLIMDPDSMLSLYIFCIIKSEYVDVILDHKFMETFMTDIDRKSMKGYHLVTLGIAFEWILSQNDDNFSVVFYIRCYQKYRKILILMLV